LISRPQGRARFEEEWEVIPVPAISQESVGAKQIGNDDRPACSSGWINEDVYQVAANNSRLASAAESNRNPVAVFGKSRQHRGIRALLIRIGVARAVDADAGIRVSGAEIIDAPAK